MLCDIILKVPETLDVSDPAWLANNLEVAWEIQQMDGEWPSFIVPSSKAVAGYKLIHASISIPGENQVALVQGLLDLYELDWEILGMMSFGAIVPVYDETDPENPILTGHIAQELKPLDVAILDYLESRYQWIPSGDPDVPPTQGAELTKSFAWIPMWQGQAQRIGA